MRIARFSRAVRWCCAPAAALSAMTIAGQALGGMIPTGPVTLAFDVNSVVVEADEDFGGMDYTGSLLVSHDANAGIADLRLNGASRSMTSELSMLDGRIDLDNGAVVGGFFTVLLADGSEYTTAIGGSAGAIEFTQADGFAVDGLTQGGVFESLPGGEFGGVDISPLTGRGVDSFIGSFLLFAFDPIDGIDTNVNLELYLTIPSPGGAALFAAGGLAALGRRR
jgi:hypothetical protein